MQPVVIVTGASRGLGAACARRAATRGARLVLSARSAGALEKLAAEIHRKGGKAASVAADLSRPGAPDRVVDSALQAYGRIDALVNNAGVLEPIAPLAKSKAAAWEHNLVVNVFAPVRLTRLALPHLREAQGRVLHVSSGAAVNVIPGWNAYCTAKAALNHFNRAVAEEEPEVTSIAFRPGVVDTAMQEVIRQEGGPGMTSEDHRKFLKYKEEGRLLPPKQPGEALAVLALAAPLEWSGEFLAWDAEKVQRLVSDHPGS